MIFSVYYKRKEKVDGKSFAFICNHSGPNMREAKNSFINRMKTLNYIPTAVTEDQKNYNKVYEIDNAKPNWNKIEVIPAKQNEGFVEKNKLMVNDMKNEIDKSLETLLKESINKFIMTEQYVESEYEKTQNQPPEYNKLAVVKLINQHPELKRDFQNYKKLYSKRDGSVMSLEIMFRNFVLNDPSFEKEYRQIVDDFQGSTSDKLPPTKK